MNNMKMYIWKNWCDKIEIEEFEVIKKLKKDIIMKMDMLIKIKWINGEIYSIISTDKNLLLSIIKNHYIEENEELEDKIKNNNIIIENVYKMQMELKYEK